MTKKERGILMINKYYKKIIFAFLIFTVVLTTFLGWSSKNIWAASLLNGLVLIIFLIHLIFNQEKEIKPWPKLLLLFVSILIISTLNSVYIYNSLIELIKIISYIILFYLATQYINSKKLVKTFCYVIIFCGVSVCVYALTKFSQLEILEMGLNSNFVWKNTYAGFLLLSLPLALALYLGSSNKFKQVVLAISFVLLASNLFFTASQAAWLSAVAGGVLIIFGLLFNKNFSKKKILLKLLFIFILSYLAITLLLQIHFYLYPGTNADLQRATSFMPTSSQARIIYWQNSLEIFKDYSLLGTGLGNFQTIYTHYFTQPWTYVSSPHNYFFYILTGTGIFATLALFIFLFSTFFKIGKRYFLEIFKPQLKKNDFSLFLGLTASVAAVFLHSLFDIDFEIPTISILWWLSLGTILYYLNKKNKTIKFTLAKKSILLFFTICLLLTTFLVLFSNNQYLKSDRLASKFNTAEQRVAQLTKAKKLMPLDANIYEALSNAYWGLILEHKGERQTNLDLTLSNAKKAVQLDSKSSHRQWFLGKMYFYTQTKDNKKWQDIINHFNLAIKYDFHDPTYYRSLAEIYLMTGETKKAKDIIDSILNIYTGEEIKKITFSQQIYENFGLKKKLDELKKLNENIN